MCSKGVKLFRGILIGSEYSGKEKLSSRVAKRIGIRLIKIQQALRKEAESKSGKYCLPTYNGLNGSNLKVNF